LAPLTKSWIEREKVFLHSEMQIFSLLACQENAIKNFIRHSTAQGYINCFSKEKFVNLVAGA